MTLTFDRANYSNLLVEVAPQAIETEEEYDRLLAVAERLTFAKNRTPEEKALHKLLVTLIEVYEAQNYPIDKSEPHEILQHIMEASGTRQAELAETAFIPTLYALRVSVGMNASEPPIPPVRETLSAQPAGDGQVDEKANKIPCSAIVPVLSWFQ